VTAGAARADRIREQLGASETGRDYTLDDVLLPPGSVVLTADEHAALIRAGDVLATRLDEIPCTESSLQVSRLAVREWLAVAHPNGTGHGVHELVEKGRPLAGDDVTDRAHEFLDEWDEAAE
jgi:hypothetical protein